MVKQRAPDVVCFLRKDGTNKFIGPGRGLEKKVARHVRDGYEIVGISRDGYQYDHTPNAWLRTIANLRDMTNDMYFCSEEQYRARTNHDKNNS